MQRQQYWQAGHAIKTYMVQKVITANPEELIVYIYDTAIAACAKRDEIKVAEAIQLLIQSLKFDNPSIAMSFYQVYNSVLDQVHHKNFEDARQVLAELRTTWSQAMKLA